jgi:glutamate-1-semialdehyde 2,1-aminomutase
MILDKSRIMQERIHRIIPGGCHTYAKGDDQFPYLSPGFIARGKGCHVWDLDGNEYIEYGMGCRAVTLGHAFEPVLNAVREEMIKGVNFSRPAPIELHCAEQLLSMVDGADMVKFVKDGSSATTAALKLARAHTGREKVAICVDHPFFATNDWFIGTTAIDAGIPESTKQLSLTFRYNDIDSLTHLFNLYPDEIACVILEPAKYDDPKDGFLHQVQALCQQNGALFVLDEMITGFRWHNGGGQKYFDIVPDLSTFGKALANGFAVSALCGKRKYMESGGIKSKQERVFLLSTTHGAETHALAAAIATMQYYQQNPVIETLNKQGEKLRQGLQQVIDHHQLSDYVQLVGRGSCMVFVCKDQMGQASQPFRTLFMQEMIRHGVLGTSFIISYSHSDADIEKTASAMDAALGVYRTALEDSVANYLVGPATDVVYRKFNQGGG